MIDKEYVEEMKHWRVNHLEELPAIMQYRISNSEQYDVDINGERCVEQDYFDVVCGKSTYRAYLDSKPELLVRSKVISLVNSIYKMGMGDFTNALEYVIGGEFNLTERKALREKTSCGTYIYNSTEERLSFLIAQIREVKNFDSYDQFMSIMIESLTKDKRLGDKYLRKFTFTIIRNQVSATLKDDSDAYKGARMSITKYTRITEDIFKVIKGLFQFRFIEEICCDLKVGDLVGEIIEPGFEFMLLSNQMNGFENTALTGLTDEITKLIEDNNNGRDIGERLAKLLISKEFGRQLCATKYILGDDLVKVNIELPRHLKERALYLFVEMYYLCLQYDKCVKTGYEFKVSEEDTLRLFTTSMCTIDSAQCLEMFGTEWINVFFDIIYEYKQANNLHFGSKDFRGYFIEVGGSFYKLDAFGFSVADDYVADFRYDYNPEGSMTSFNRDSDYTDNPTTTGDLKTSSLFDDEPAITSTIGDNPNKDTNDIDSSDSFDNDVSTNSELKPSSVFDDELSDNTVEPIKDSSELDIINDLIMFEETSKIGYVLTSLGFPEIGNRRDKIQTLQAVARNSSKGIRIKIIELLK